VSLAFLSPVVGYTAAALLNSLIHEKLGQRGIAFIAPLMHIIAYVILCCHPPYGVCVVAFLIAGFGNGLEDSAWNAWVGPMKNSNQVLGLMHGSYGTYCILNQRDSADFVAGLGATISPLIATTMITKSHLQWYTFFYIMVSNRFFDIALVSAYYHYRSEPPVSKLLHPSQRSGKLQAPNIVRTHLVPRAETITF